MTTKAKKDYSQGKIYKIEPTIEHDEGDIYIGSTTKKYLSQRMAGHKQSYNLWVRNNSYTSTTSFKLFEKYGFENCTIILLENVNASNYDELASREAYHIKNIKCVNISIPLRTDAEYYQDNKEILKEKKTEYMKQYAEKRKEEIKIYKKQYGENNKQKIKEHNAEWYEANKIKLNEKLKLYRQNNRDKVNEQQRIRYKKKKQEKESLGNV